MYTPAEREHLRSVLVAAARADRRIIGAAMTGSAALGREDEWSDVDLAFGVAEAVELSEVLADWTEMMYREHGVVHHVDVTSGATIYRVFLLANTLQVDLAFSPAAEFGARAPTFRLLFGVEVKPPYAAPPAAANLIGMGWLYALHARSCIVRGKVWQAEYMISGVRDHVLALACLRLGLPAVQGRGLDRLPPEVTSPLEGALVRALDNGELKRSFGVAVEGLLSEIRQADAELASRIQGPLLELAAPPSG